MNIYNIFFMVVNTFHVYTIFRFICIFFKERKTNKLIEFASYVTFCVAGIAINLFVTIPIVMILFSIIGTFLLSLNYYSTIKKRFFVTLLTFTIMAMMEMLVAFLLTNIKFALIDKTYFNSIPCLVITRILTFAVVLAIGNIKLSKEEFAMPRSYWLSVIFIPIASAVIALGVFEVAHQSKAFVAVTSALVLGINFTVFHLYQEIILSTKAKLDRQAMLQQSLYYQHEITIIQKALTDTSKIRHDMKNHLTTIYGMLNEDKTAQCTKYIQELIKIDSCEQLIAKSGNSVIDSILNFKLQYVAQSNIVLTIKLDIPKEIDISSLDISTILGNLVDNSIEAVLKTEGERLINVSIAQIKGMFIIAIDNSFDGCVEQEGAKFLSSKRKFTQEGIGFESVRDTINKYNGALKISFNDNIFHVKALLYIMDK